MEAEPLLHPTAARSHHGESTTAKAAVSSAAAIVRATSAALVPVLILLPPLGVEMDVVSMCFLATDAVATWWVLLVLQVAAWRALMLCMAVRPALTLRNVTVLLLPGMAHQLIAHIIERRAGAEGKGDDVLSAPADDALRSLHQAVGTVPPADAHAAPPRRRSCCTG